MINISYDETVEWYARVKDPNYLLKEMESLVSKAHNIEIELRLETLLLGICYSTNFTNDQKLELLLKCQCNRRQIKAVLIDCFENLENANEHIQKYLQDDDIFIQNYAADALDFVLH